MVFSPAPWFRIMFLFLAGIIIFGIFTISGDGDSGGFFIPVIIAVICVAASLYEESWLFDRNRRIIIHKAGLMFFSKTKTISFAEVDYMQLYVFLRGVKADRQADHELDLTKPFSRENTEDASGKGTRIIHKKYQQELKLVMKTGDKIAVESLASRGTEALAGKAGILSEFSGIRLVK